MEEGDVGEEVGEGGGRAQGLDDDVKMSCFLDIDQPHYQKYCISILGPMLCKV
jgi:hypothetical protein